MPLSAAPGLAGRRWPLGPLMVVSLAMTTALFGAAGPAGAARPTQGNGPSSSPALSADGRYVAFASAATNLVRGDTNRVTDIFVRDRTAGTTRRVNVTSAGRQANGASTDPSISRDGRYVAYTSTASNLVPGDTNRAADVFRYDKVSGRTTRVSVPRAGGQVAGRSSEPDLAASGRYVAFTSAASNVVPGDTNGAADVFVRDVVAGITTRVSVGEHGEQADAGSRAPTISADGQRVGFYSAASNLLPDSYGTGFLQAGGYVRDRAARTTIGLDVSGDADCGVRRIEPPAVTDDGRSAAQDSVGGCADLRYAVFVTPLQAGGVSAAVQSAEGSYCAVESGGAISGNGSRLAYYDPCRAESVVVNVLTGTEIGQVALRAPLVMSADGRSVATVTDQALTADDTNGHSDVYVWTPDLSRIRRVSVG